MITSQIPKKIGVSMLIILLIILPIMFIFGCDTHYPSVSPQVIVAQQPAQPTQTTQASNPIPVQLVDSDPVPDTGNALTINVNTAPPPIVVHQQLSCPFGTIPVPEDYTYSLLGGYRLIPAHCDATHIGMTFHAGYWSGGLWHASSWGGVSQKTVINNTTIINKQKEPVTANTVWTSKTSTTTTTPIVQKVPEVRTVKVIPSSGSTAYSFGATPQVSKPVSAPTVRTVTTNTASRTTITTTKPAVSTPIIRTVRVSGGKK